MLDVCLKMFYLRFWCFQIYKLFIKKIVYIVDLYQKLEGKVTTQIWEPDGFALRKGILQGDPYFKK